MHQIEKLEFLGILWYKFKVAYSRFSGKWYPLPLLLSLCYIPAFHQIEKLEFLSVLLYKFKVAYSRFSGKWYFLHLLLSL